MATHTRAFVARHKHGMVISVALGLVMTVQAVIAPAFQGDAATLMPTGQALAANCMQCHGTNGMNGGFDALAGDGAADTFDKLKDFQNDSGIMGVHARGYSDDELRQIANYFAGLPTS